MASMNNNQKEQMDSLGFSPPVLSEEDFIFQINSQLDDQTTPTVPDVFQGFKTLDQEILEWDRNEAVAWAGYMGTLDTVRGIKQLVGFDQEQEEADQRLLNKLMEHPEWGDWVKGAWMTGMIVDPATWIIPVAKARTVGKLAWEGAKWGGAAGFLGYVDKDVGVDRLLQAGMGAAGGAFLAPIVGKTGQTISKYVSRKSAKELTDNPKATTEDFKGQPSETTVGSVNRFLYTGFQPFADKYHTFLKTKLRDPIFDNPIPSTIGAGAAYGVFEFGGEGVHDYLEDREYALGIDTGALGSALIGAAGIVAAVASGKGAKFLMKSQRGVEKASTPIGRGIQSVQSKGNDISEWYGRRFLENYNLPTDAVKLKESVGSGLQDLQWEWNQLIVKLSELPADENKLIYQFLQGEARTVRPDDPTVYSKPKFEVVEKDTTKNLKNIPDSDREYEVIQTREGILVTESGQPVSKELHELSKEAQNKLIDIGQRFVDAGAISPEAFQRNLGQYIHRTYAKHEQIKLNNKQGIFHESEKVGIIGTASMKRGYTRVVNKNRNLDKETYSLIDDDVKVGNVWKRIPESEQSKGLNSDQVEYWRPLSKQERIARGEIEHAAHAMFATQKIIFNDLAVLNYYTALNKQFSKTQDEFLKLAPEERFDWVRVSTESIPKTGDKVKRYGKLAGKYLPRDVYEDIRIHSKMKNWEKEGFTNSPGWNNFIETYRKYNRFWKATRTIYSPTTHGHNFFSNIVLSDFHNNPISNVLRYGLKVWTKKGQRTLNNDPVFGPVYDDMTRLGVFDVSLIKGELGIQPTKKIMEIYETNLKKAAASKDHVAAVEAAYETAGQVWLLKSGKTAKDMTKKGWEGAKAAHRGLGWTYQNEDSMFRVGHYIQRLKETMPQLKGLQKGTKEYDITFEKLKREAAKSARKAFIDYNIQAPGVQLLRETALPFLAYSWRVFPILANIATTKPHKILKWSAIAYAINYAANEQSGDNEDYERYLMDREKSKTIFGIPLLFPPSFIKVPNVLQSIEAAGNKRFDLGLDFNLNKERQLHLSTRRIVPGGDFFTSNEMGIGFLPGLPAAMQPSFGILGALILPAAGIDPFTWSPLDRTSASAADVATTDRLIAMAKQILPNNPLVGISGWQWAIDEIPGVEYSDRFEAVDSWSHKRMRDAAFLSDTYKPFQEHLPVWMVLLQNIGIKLWPWEEEVKWKQFLSRIKKPSEEASRKIYKLWRDFDKKYSQFRDTDRHSLWEAQYDKTNEEAARAQEEFNDFARRKAAAISKARRKKRN